jgi:hypothetical protein
VAGLVGDRDLVVTLFHIAGDDTAAENGRTVVAEAAAE